MQSNEFHACFPTHLGVISLREHPLFNDIQTELSEFIESQATFQYMEAWGKTHEVSASGMNNLTRNDKGDSTTDLFDKLSVLPNIVNKEVLDFAMRVNSNVDRIQATHLEHRGSWISRFNEGDYAHTHPHRPSLISGVYYHQLPKTSKKRSGSFYVESPVPFHVDKAMGMQGFDRIFVGEVLPIHEGTLILFPSYLEHGVTRHLEKTPRISVSFNYFEVWKEEEIIHGR